MALMLVVSVGTRFFYNVLIPVVGIGAGSDMPPPLVIGPTFQLVPMCVICRCCSLLAGL